MDSKVRHIHDLAYISLHIYPYSEVWTSIENLIWPGQRSPEDLWMGFVDDYHNKYQTGGLQHLLSRQIREEIGEELHDSYYKFTMVRNPWDKAVSQYCYMSEHPGLRAFIGMKRDDCFKKYLRLIRKRTHVQWELQVNFLKDINGDSLVDYVGRFENYNQSVLNVLEKLGIDEKKIPHINRSNRKPYSSYYDSESIELVNELYASDIEEFGYCYA